MARPRHLPAAAAGANPACGFRGRPRGRPTLRRRCRRDRRNQHHGWMNARGFAGRDEIGTPELLGAPVRTPRPSRLARPLELAPKAKEAAESLGLHDIGDLLEHVPRARREARTIGALVPGETATVLVEV